MAELVLCELVLMGLGMSRSGLAEGQHIKSEISMMPRRAIGYSNK